jgi:hypothetical protein
MPSLTRLSTVILGKDVRELMCPSLLVAHSGQVVTEAFLSMQQP